MPTNNFKLFDENKANMMTDDDYAINQQRLNGVQSGVASSQLQNKTLYQTALMCYALAQLMAANGYDANDANAVSTFVNNLSLSVLQKVADKASADDIKNKVAGKWVDSSIFGQNMENLAETYLKLDGGTMTGDLILHSDPTQSLQAATKQYVDKLIDIKEYTGTGDKNFKITFDIVPYAILIKRARVQSEYGEHYAAEGCLLLSKNANTADISIYADSCTVTATFNNKTVSILQTYVSSKFNGLNKSGSKFVAVAIGDV